MPPRASISGQTKDHETATSRITTHEIEAVSDANVVRPKNDYQTAEGTCAAGRTDFGPAGAVDGRPEGDRRVTPAPSTKSAVTALAVVVAATVIGAVSARSATPTAGCTPAQTIALVNRFIAAFNGGDRWTLNNRLWGGRLYFNWFAVTTAPGLRIDAEAGRRDDLMDYFAARHAANERLTLTRLKLGGVTGGGYRNFEFRLTRGSNDQASGPVLYEGKGASACLTGRLTTWVMGVART